MERGEGVDVERVAVCGGTSSGERNTWDELDNVERNVERVSGSRLDGSFHGG